MRRLGDPEFLTLVPSDQYLTHYAFYMDPSYLVSSLTVVRQRGEDGFAPVTLDCLGEVQGFKAIDPDDTQEVARVDMSGRGGQSCGPGGHEASSPKAFAIYVWGLATASSYAYAGGQGLRPLFTPVVNVPR